MKKILLYFAIFALAFTPVALCAQHLFEIVQNDLSKEKLTQLQNKIAQSEISTLTLTKNNEDNHVYSFSLPSAKNKKIIILNEQTGKHVTIIPVEETRNEFQLAPFFIKEMEHGALGDAAYYLVINVVSDVSVEKVYSVAASNDEVYIPQFFFRKNEEVKEALPKDRQILGIYKQKPRLILAYPDDPELLSYAAQYEEAMSYYVYLYKLPDGTLCTYDEHFNPIPGNSAVTINGPLQFTLTGNLNTTQKPPTEYALSLWSQKLAGTVPVKINVDSKNLQNPNVIGQSWQMTMAQNTGQVPTSPTETWYPGSLWNQLVGFPQIAGYNIKLEMNSQFSFYYGITGNPSGSQIDWVTTMLHEVNHGLGFFPICQSNGSYYANNNTQNPGIFDRQLFQGTNGPCLTDLNQSERAALMKSNNLYAGAPDSYLLAAHGSRVKMYAPTSYQSGSSCSHWDSYQSFTTFMKYYIDWGWKWETITTREVGILKDIGWKEPDPNAIYVTFNSNGGEGTMSQQQFVIGVAQNLTPNTFTKPGYSFTKWNTNQNGTGTSYQDGQSITINSGLTLYAQWEARNFTLTFSPGTGGSVDIPSKEVTFDKPIGSLPTAERPGYQFQGWRIGTTDINENYIYIFPQNETASAKWLMITYTITASATPGGKISPSGSVVVQEGSDKTYLITPDPDFWLEVLLIDDESVSTVLEYEFKNVTQSHTIHAVFTPLGIHDNLLENYIQIFPNPTTGQLIVQSSKFKVQSIEVFDVYGRKVLLPSLSVLWSYDLTVLQAGIYFLKIETENGTITKKIIKL